MKKRNPSQVKYEFGDPRSGQKLRQLVLYVASKCASHKHFGVVKLNKILFFSDAVTYAATGKPITGAEYLALPAGPAPRRMPDIIAEMLEHRAVAEELRVKPGGLTEKRLVATEKPDLSLFTGTEIALVDSVIEACRRKTASDVSYLSHGIPWTIGRKATGSIPYEAIYVSNRAPSDYQVARSRELIEKHRWGA